MVASHNSWSYAHPLKWWMWFVALFSKCQSKTIQEQVESGAVMLDLRLKMYKGSMYVAHGAYIADTYAHAYSEICMTLPKYVRVFMESRHPSNAEILLFKDCCNELQRSFPEVTFVGGHGAHEPNWGVQYFDFGTTEPHYTEYHASVCGGYIPFLWSRRNNKYMPDADLVMIDFI